ncbi:MAG: heavy-metal-associated domain-containing protein [Cyanobacteria bacterium J083]|nr:MAG: heavy-metal-associated domain-containing protein [Cyanobacteria bacterium J083]
MNKTSHLQLENMMCDFCAETIERAVQSLPGVNNCKVDMTTKKATIQYTESVNLDKIQQALAKAGYQTQLLD